MDPRSQPARREFLRKLAWTAGLSGPHKCRGMATMLPRKFYSLIATVLIPGTVACNGGKVVEPVFEPRPAILQFYSDPVRTDLPDTVTVASAFTVSVRSYGGGCTSQGETEAEVEGLLATIRPFDLVLTDPNVVCIQILRVFEHVATIRFDQPGMATVRVVGRREPGDEPLSVDRTLVVR